MNPEQQHALLSILKSQERPYTILELADRLSLTPEQAKELCNQLLALDLIDLEPLRRMFGQRETDFGFVLTCKGRWIFGQVNLAPMITGFNKE